MCTRSCRASAPTAACRNRRRSSRRWCAPTPRAMRRSPGTTGSGSIDMKVLPSGDSLGATLEGLELARPLAREELDQVLQALGRYGVVRFPSQRLTGQQLRDFSAQLGDLEINVGSAGYQEPGVPEVM